MDRIIKFIKKEAVLSIATILAIASCFFVKPSKDYLSYIDFNTLFLLFSLMAVMALFKELGVFEKFSRFLLSHVTGIFGILCVLIFLPFVLSMLITNDVALITFVPLALITLNLSGLDSLAIPVVILQTVAANLGSMMLPMGNPQNLYLFNVSKMPLWNFIKLMAPYTVASFILILLSIIILCRIKRALIPKQAGTFRMPHHGNKISVMIVSCVCFLLCLLSVLKIVDAKILFLIVVVLFLIFKRRILLKVDYCLLLTFCAFFVFVGNMKNIPLINDFLLNAVQEKEILSSIISSQVISNVPAALLLSGFTQNYSALIVGTNLGGLGTLIASMASLISFKLFSQSFPQKKACYILHFSWVNATFLAVLYGIRFVI